MNEKKLSSGELRMFKAFRLYEQKKLAQLDEKVDDINLINKVKSNIKLYEKQIKKFEK